MPRGIGRIGAAGCTILSHCRQDFFSRAVSITFSCEATSSSISATSSPIRRKVPPQSGQRSPGSSTMRARTVVGPIRGLPRRRGRARSEGASGVATASAGAAVSAVAIATSRSSSASCSCSISRSIFSELDPNFCRLSLAMRILSAWISAS